MAYAQPVYAALDGPFTEASSGFVGSASDGLDAARRHAALTGRRGAVGGNVVQTARVAAAKDGRAGSRSASARAGGGGRYGRGLAGRGFDKALAEYKKGWNATTAR